MASQRETLNQQVHLCVDVISPIQMLDIMMNRKLFPILAFALAIAFALSPIISNGFGGFSKDDFPVDAPWYAQPAGWAFSIWALIYVALIVGTAIGAFRKDNSYWFAASLPLSVSLAFGVPWVEMGDRSPLIATFMMVPIWAGAVVALFRAGPQQWQRIPLGLYAGWLTAAMCVAFSVSATGYGWLSPMVSAVLALSIAVFLALSIIRQLPYVDWAYRLIFVWALAGIIAANWDPINLTMVVMAGVAIPLVLFVPPRQISTRV